MIEACTPRENLSVRWPTFPAALDAGVPAFVRQRTDASGRPAEHGGDQNNRKMQGRRCS
jgi:hypothetical protein